LQKIAVAHSWLNVIQFPLRVVLLVLPWVLTSFTFFYATVAADLCVALASQNSSALGGFAPIGQLPGCSNLSTAHRWAVADPRFLCPFRHTCLRNSAVTRHTFRFWTISLRLAPHQVVALLQMNSQFCLCFV